MTIEPLTIKSINQVFDDPWESGVESASLAGISLEDEKDYFISKINKPFSGSFFIDDKCCALCACHSSGFYRLEASFMASREGWEKVWFPITRFFAGFSTKLLENFDQIEAYSPFNYGKVLDWYKVMGFFLDGQKDRLYRYKKVASC